jgi:hypothetical protein
MVALPTTDLRAVIAHGKMAQVDERNPQLPK